MRLTLLGTGDAVGVPAPLCDCEYCAASERRRRPGLLVEAGGTTLLFDAPPDVTEGLHATGTTALDAVFLTHAHYDHFAGVNELNHARYERHVLNESDYDHPHPLSEELTVYANDSVLSYVAETRSHLTRRLEFEAVVPGESATVGPVTVEPFAVEHGGPRFDTQGYVVRGPSADGGETTVGYVPDANAAPDPSTLPPFDLLLFEGSVLGPELHADAAELRAGLDRLDVERVVPTNVSEHQAELHTRELRERAADLGYEMWADFDSAEV